MTELQKRNPHIAIRPLSDPAFGRYGRVLALDAGGMLDGLRGRTVEKGYSMSDPELEKTALFSYFEGSFYGGMPIQAGICAGTNTRLNCFEYHRGVEVNIAATDMVLLLGYTGDLQEGCIDAGAAQAFYVPQGACVALYETTMHYSPLCVDTDGFVCIVLLPRGTNAPLCGDADVRMPEDKLLNKKNKWLLGHAQSDPVQKGGAFCGITGENITITPLEAER